MQHRISSILVLSLLVLPAVVLAQDGCGKLQPDYQSYMAKKYGDSPNSLLPTIRDSEACEKIRLDMRIYHCRYNMAETAAGLRRNLKKDSLGTPMSVVRAKSYRADQVGGEEAKQRNIERAWESYRRDSAKMQSLRLKRSEAKAGYLAAHQAWTGNQCTDAIFPEGQDPFVDGK